MPSASGPTSNYASRHQNSPAFSLLVDALRYRATVPLVRRNFLSHPKGLSFILAGALERIQAPDQGLIADQILSCYMRHHGIS